MSTSRPVPRPTTAARLRRWVCLATVLACLPYLSLKTAWIVGWPLGVSNDGAFEDTTRIANVVTAGLDLVAIAVAVAFVAPVGRRLPAFAVAFPVWIATGLLSPVLIGVVAGAPLQVVTGGGNPFTGDDVLAPWVFGLVYGGFALQAVLLGAGFVLYARDRWPWAFRANVAASRVPVATQSLQRLLAGIFAVAALAYGGVQLSNAVLDGGRFTDVQTSQRALLIGATALAVAGAWALLGATRGTALAPRRLVLAWLGTAVVFTDALSQTLTAVTIEPGSWGASHVGAGQAALMLFALLGAAAGAIGGTLRLVEAERPIGNSDGYPCWRIRMWLPNGSRSPMSMP